MLSAKTRVAKEERLALVRKYHNGGHSGKEPRRDACGACSTLTAPRESRREAIVFGRYLNSSCLKDRVATWPETYGPAARISFHGRRSMV